MDATMNGIDVVLFGSGGKNLYNVLDDLYQDVLNGEPADVINKHINDLQAGQSHILAQTALVGGRMNRLDLFQSRYEQDFINYSQMKSDAEDADEAEVIMNYKMAEAVYNAALASGARIIQPTLMDFLR